MIRDDLKNWKVPSRGKAGYSPLSVLLTTMYLCLAWYLGGSVVMDEWLISILQMSKQVWSSPVAQR